MMTSGRLPKQPEFGKWRVEEKLSGYLREKFDRYGKPPDWEDADCPDSKASRDRNFGFRSGLGIVPRSKRAR